jgi:glycosyltransferase involved in cell wall biosynthesis
LSSISAKKNIIILAGYDCYSFPSINYGAFTKRVLGKVVAWSCRNASHLIVVHESMINSEYSYDQLSNKRQGIRYFVPNLKTSITPVYYGYDTSAFYRKKLERSKNSFVTLAAGISGSLFFRKGIDLIIEVAQRLPNCKFTIIGTSQPEHVHLPDNVEVLPPVPHNQVNDYLNRYEFYLQLSMAEGFPNALCEAMLAGCIPIGSGVFSIPFIIGDSGFILEKKDVNELAELCTKAISHPDKAELSKRASERIANNFPSLRRKQALINIIERL